VCTGLGPLKVPGAGPPPKANRRRRNLPTRGDWQPSAAVGWQHGPIPEPPEGLMPASLELWKAWFTSWVAAHWSPLDVGGLRQLIRVHDEVERGEFQRQTEFRLGMDTFGISPKGQQDRHWLQPKEGEEAPAPKATGRYAHLKVVSE
jgi:hypothetical protein